MFTSLVVHALAGSDGTTYSATRDGPGTAHAESRKTLRIAICSVGLLRTFVLPDMISSLIHNVLKSSDNYISSHPRFSSVQTDLYLYGSLPTEEIFNSVGWRNVGDVAGIWGQEMNYSRKEVREVDDARLRLAMRQLRPWLAYVELWRSNDAPLVAVSGRNQSAFDAAFAEGNGSAVDRLSPSENISEILAFSEWVRASGFSSRQFVYMNRCFKKVLQQPDYYDLVVRTRPDVMFSPEAFLEKSIWTLEKYKKLYNSAGPQFVIRYGDPESFWSGKLGRTVAGNDHVIVFPRASLLEESGPWQTVLEDPVKNRTLYYDPYMDDNLFEALRPDIVPLRDSVSEFYQNEIIRYPFTIRHLHCNVLRRVAQNGLREDQFEASHVCRTRTGVETDVHERTSHYADFLGAGIHVYKCHEEGLFEQAMLSLSKFCDSRVSR